jgi:hypothetical protein
MLAAIRLLTTLTALGEVAYFWRATASPDTAQALLAILAAVAWLVLPLLTLTLAASDQGLRAARVTVLVAAVLSACVAVLVLAPWGGLSHNSPGGMEPLFIPAVQWVFVLVALLVLRALNRTARTEAMRA